jgi:hypothetical protein
MHKLSAMLMAGCVLATVAVGSLAVAFGRVGPSPTIAASAPVVQQTVQGKPIVQYVYRSAGQGAEGTQRD